MGLYESRGQLSKALKELLIKWRQTRSVWTDEQAEQFDRDVFGPLERATRSAGEAMDTMTQATNAARRDCS